MWNSSEPLKKLNTGQKSQMRIINNSLFIDPPLDHLRMLWTSQFQEWVNIVVLLPRIRLFQYNKKNTYEKLDFVGVVAQLPMEKYTNCFHLVEKHYQEVAKYVQEWVRYQALWDIETSSVYDILDTDLSKWQKAMTQIKRQRSTFDTSKTSMSFNWVEIDFESVQQKVAAKYDQWQRDLLTKYSSITYNRSVTFLQCLKDARQYLEISIGSLTSDMVNFIIMFKKLQDNKDVWKNEIDLLEKGQKILDKNRFNFPSDWIQISHLLGEWGSFSDILYRKEKIVDFQLGKHILTKAGLYMIKLSSKR